MTANETFLMRWSRLKRESDASESASDEHRAHHPKQAPDAKVRDEPALVRSSDLTALPPIELISAHSDVSAFLHAGVPEELTRAALRRAWTTDPAIREFIGIADNQWDFNGEHTIAGFGSIEPDDCARYFAALGGNLDDAPLPAPMVPGLPESCASAPAEPPVAGREEGAESPVVDRGRPAAAPEREARCKGGSGPIQSEEKMSATSTPPARTSESAAAVNRRHGSALPKWVTASLEASVDAGTGAGSCGVERGGAR